MNFEEYKYLAESTVRKYYKHYLKTWEEDIMQTAYLGLYIGLTKIDENKDELSRNSFLICHIRGEIKNWERSIFGTEKTLKRKETYEGMGLTCSAETKTTEELTVLDTIADEHNEDTMVQNIDLYRAIEKLSEEERIIISYLLEGRRMAEMSRETGTNKDKLQRQKKRALNKLKEMLKEKIS